MENSPPEGAKQQPGGRTSGLAAFLKGAAGPDGAEIGRRGTVPPFEKLGEGPAAAPRARDATGEMVPADKLEEYNRIAAGETPPSEEFWDDHPGLDYVLGDKRPTPPEELCPAGAAGARLLAFTGLNDGGVIAAYDDGSLWARPPGPAGEGVRWYREAGPAWATAPARERTLAIFKAELVRRSDLYSGAIADALQRMLDLHGLSVAKMKRVEVPPELARELYREHAGRPYFDNLIGSVAGHCVVAVFEGEGAVERWRAAIGPSDPEKWGPWHLRLRYGAPRAGNIANNGFHGSDSQEAAEREIELFLPLLREAPAPGAAGGTA